jgi:hypothetical protein
MRALAQIFRVLEFGLMTLVVAGFMLAFIYENSREFFVCLMLAPLGLLFHGMSTMLGPRTPDEF